MGEFFDLFGDPIPEGFSKRGRPPHVVDVKKRNKVMLLLAVGRKLPEIAAALGISEPTLRKNYFRELRTRDEARFRVEGANLLKLYEQVDAGNVAAIKEMRKVLDHAAASDGEFYKRANANAQASSAASKPKKLGKKEQALLDAQRPDSETPLGRLMALRAEENGKPN